MRNFRWRNQFEPNISMPNSNFVGSFIRMWIFGTRHQDRALQLMKQLIFHLAWPGDRALLMFLLYLLGHSWDDLQTGKYIEQLHGRWAAQPCVMVITWHERALLEIGLKLQWLGWIGMYSNRNDVGKILLEISVEGCSIFLNFKRNDCSEYHLVVPTKMVVPNLMVVPIWLNKEPKKSQN